MTDAEVTCREPAPGTVEIVVTGEIDLQNAGAVERRIHDMVDNEARSVTIDLGALEYLDSAGLRVLFTLASRLELLQVAFDVRVPEGSIVRRAVDLSGLGDIVAVH
ncbi:STAS domain-containing protein [Pseudonocardia benzenivorans]|jgi:anti-anti-sigma factor|uniref:STAS domain-containing protein n=1 Tax=Pseudonocardia benzenivorans TaxID=228005 RepID=A0ABW3VJG8_9PSEU